MFAHPANENSVLGDMQPLFAQSLLGFDTNADTQKLSQSAVRASGSHIDSLFSILGSGVHDSGGFGGAGAHVEGKQLTPDMYGHVSQDGKAWGDADIYSHFPFITMAGSAADDMFGFCSAGAAASDAAPTGCPSADDTLEPSAAAGAKVMAQNPKRLLLKKKQKVSTGGGGAKAKAKAKAKGTVKTSASTVAAAAGRATVADKLGRVRVSTGKRGVADPVDFAGFTDDQICDLAFHVLLERLASLDEDMQTKIKERRKQLKNRVHAKRAAAKRNKRVNNTGVENDALKLKAHALVRDNARLVAESEQMVQQKKELNAILHQHHDHMNLLRVKIEQMSIKLQQAQRANAEAPTPTETAPPTHAETAAHAAQTPSVPLASQSASPASAMLALESEVHVQSGLKPAAAAAAAAAEVPAADGDDGCSNVVVEGTVPDSLTLPPSPEIEVDLNQLALSCDNASANLATKRCAADEISSDVGIARKKLRPLQPS